MLATYPLSLNHLGQQPEIWEAPVSLRFQTPLDPQPRG